MCGFVGFFATSPGSVLAPRWIRSLIDILAHRGPDDDGILVDRPFGLGFRRLAILDLTPAGHQPMTSADGAHSLVFNGEIYNYIELRDELSRLGHRFRSSGDTEVLLAAYRQWGEQCVEHLVGMFAFCVVDHRSNTMFAARDRFGIKPLFFVRHETGVLFASELKAIRRSGLWNGRLNVTRFAEFLSVGRSEEVDEDENTYLDGVGQIRPAHSCVVRFDGSMRIRRYWTPPDAPLVSSRHAPEEFLAAFDESLRVHMRSDVPVGVMLSGGMDSASIACSVAQRGANRGMHAFCYESPEFDEVRQVTDTVEATGATLHVTRGLTPEAFWQTLRRLVWHHDEPIHSTSALMGFELYRMAAEHGVKVILCGQGADETLGGYHYLFDHMLVSEVMQGRLVSTVLQARAASRTTGKSSRALLMRCAVLVRAHVLRDNPAYRARAAQRRLLRGEGRRYLAPEFRDLAPPHHESPTGQTLAAALRRSTVQSPLPHYLRAEDRNSMAHGVEARVPFLDHRLVELAMRLPGRWQMFDGWNKRVLREAMRGRIPESVRSRREKFGFPTSAARWFAGPLAGGLREIIEDGALMRTGWFDRDAVRTALHDHVQGHSASKLLFNVAQLEAWMTLNADGWTASGNAVGAILPGVLQSHRGLAPHML